MTKIQIVFLCSMVLLTACSPQEKNGSETVTPPPPAYGDTAEGPDNRNTPKPGKESEELPAQKAEAAGWRTLLKEYRDILCRQHNGTSTTTDKIRLTELNEELDRMQRQLAQSEQPEFIAEKAKAIETESCP